MTARVGVFPLLVVAVQLCVLAVPAAARAQAKTRDTLRLAELQTVAAQRAARGASD